MNFRKISTLSIFFLLVLGLVSCVTSNNETKKFKVTLELNGGVGETSIEVEDGSYANIENPTKTDYIFRGWFKDSSFSVSFDPSQTPIKEDIKLYAKWDLVLPNFYQIIYETNGGNPLLPMSAARDSNLVDFTVVIPTKNKHEFKGWFKDANLTQVVLDTDKINQNITLYAKWEEIINYFEVTFISNGGSDVNKQVIKENEKVIIPTEPTRQGNYAFGGWYLDEALTNSFDFNTQITSNITLYAKWLNVYSVTFNTNGGSQIATQMITHGQKPAEPQDPIKEGYNFIGWSKKADDLDPFDFNEVITKNTTIYAIYELGEAVGISTKEELLELFIHGGGGNYKLLNDIDFSGTTFEVPNTSRIFTGSLDGDYYRIKNLVATSASNKQGVFFKILQGTIKNLVIENSSFAGGGEASGFIAAHIHGGAIVEHVEFFNVIVTNTGDYTALIAGDDANNQITNKPITISNIIVRNFGDKVIRSNKSAAFLVGYLRVNGATLNINNVYLEGSLESVAENTAFILARINATVTVNVKDAVFKGDMTATKQIGSVVGQSSQQATINIENAFMGHGTFIQNETTNNSFVGNNQGVITYKHAYYDQTNLVLKRNVAGDLSAMTPNQGQAILPNQITEAWLLENSFSSLFKVMNNTVTLNRDIVEEAIDLHIDLSQLPPIFVVGDTVDLDQVIVSIIYNTGRMEVVDALVESEDLDTSKAGTYQVAVTYEKFVKNFNISIYEIESIYIYETNFMDLYILGQELNTNDLYVYARLSNGKELKLDKEALILDTNFNKNEAGNYYIQYGFGSLMTPNIEITVMDQTVTAAAEVIVTVDQSQSNTTTHTNLTFKTIRKALTYLKKSGLANDVNKVIYIKNGTYYEKLEVDMQNVIFIGENQDQTIITYNKASGNMTPQGGSFGTQGSATFAVKPQARGFIMYNLSVKNEFDYANATINDKQGVALVSEADQAIYYKVKFFGVQDTLYAKSGRQWYYQVYVEGSVDYIFGNGGPVFIEDSQIHTLGRTGANQYITAYKGFNGNSNLDGLIEYGVIFYQNRITAGSNDTLYLGRPWAQDASVLFMNNIFEAKIHADGWTSMSGNTPELARFYEYKNKDINGNILPNTLKAKSLSDEVAAKWANKAIFFAETNGGITFSGVFNYNEQMTKLNSYLT